MPAPPDLLEVSGRETPKRALEIAAAGGHSLLLIGPAGCGKTLLARCLHRLLPALTDRQAAELEEIYAAAGEAPAPRAGGRSPFRAPPPELTVAGLVGDRCGVPRPGEVSLAHFGVLCLDDLPEFPKATLAALPKVLDDGHVRLRGTSGYRTYPCSLLWAATMRSCPCGRGPRLQDCRCTPGQRRRFRRQVPQALRDRVDLVVEVASVDEEELRRKGSESSRVVAQRVAGARRRQRERGLSFPETDEAKVLSGWLNRDLTAGQTGRVCALDTQGTLLLEAARERFDLSVRRRFQVLKMARTIADLQGTDVVRAPHLAEALQYRMLDDVSPAYINKESAR